MVCYRDFIVEGRSGDDQELFICVIGGTSQVALVVKILPANAGDIKDAALTWAGEDPLDERLAIHSSMA